MEKIDTLAIKQIRNKFRFIIRNQGLDLIWNNIDRQVITNTEFQLWDIVLAQTRTQTGTQIKSNIRYGYGKY